METASKFRAKRIQNARVQAFRHPLLSFNGGVVFDDPNDKENIFLRHTRYWKPVDRTDYTLDFSNFVAGSYIYGGPIYNHFGHFMSEMIHRITLARILNPGQKIVFVAPPTTLSKIPDPPKYIEAILNFIGVNRSDYIVVNVDSTIEELFVIESGSDLGGGPKPYYADFLRDNYRIKDLDGFKYKYGGKKMFVSRSRLNHGGASSAKRTLRSGSDRLGSKHFSQKIYHLTSKLQLIRCRTRWCSRRAPPAMGRSF
ncbi:hypothetical protein V5F40_16065 [Xanthobacter sp. DSM 14520]|uniref:hypothetical protein n=1 Tax=Xanthobacter autotrophicus (strain ATCC BAA-1158 / Py2) TaxID=78245 RepID=UPI00372C4D78